MVNVIVVISNLSESFVVHLFAKFAFESSQNELPGNHVGGPSNEPISSFGSRQFNKRGTLSQLEWQQFTFATPLDFVRVNQNS